LEKKIIPVEKLLVQSNAPFSSFEESTHSDKIWESMKDFQLHFLRKQLRYLHPESLKNMFSEAGNVAPTILHCVIEILAGIVDVPPLSLAKILNENAESFYKFSSPSKPNAQQNTK
jgi:Tat protein secretion system quality control protein TatD with DNase activity